MMISYHCPTALDFFDVLVTLHSYDTTNIPAPVCVPMDGKIIDLERQDSAEDPNKLKIISSGGNVNPTHYGMGSPATLDRPSLSMTSIRRTSTEARR